MKGRLKITARQAKTQQIYERVEEQVLRDNPQDSSRVHPLNLVPAVAEQLGIGLDEAEFRMGELAMASSADDLMRDHFSWN